MSQVSDNRLVKYLRESKEEMQKVTWPSQKDTIRYSVIVSVITIACGIYFGAADWIIQQGLKLLVNLT